MQSAGLPDAESKVNGKVESEAATDVATAKNDELKGQKDQGSSRAQRDASAADAAAGYGTRSRNRTSQHRPNYAEDKDIENDLYDFYHDGKDGDAKKSARGNGELTRSAASTRKSAAFAAATTTTTTVAAASDEVKTATQANGAKETANSVTNTAQPAGPSQPTRKRKAAAAAANTQQSNGSTHVATRRAGNASQTATAANATSWADTNLLTFETCKGRPDNGRMVADDGTVLAANGKQSPTPKAKRWPRQHSWGTMRIWFHGGRRAWDRRAEGGLPRSTQPQTQANLGSPLTQPQLTNPRAISNGER